MSSQLVSSFDDALLNAIEFSKIGHNRGSISYQRFAKFTHWYYFPEQGIFAPSKFIGYTGTNIENYVGGDSGDGGETETVLHNWFNVLDKSKKQFGDLYIKLKEFADENQRKINSNVLNGKGGIHYPKKYNISGRPKRELRDNKVFKSGGPVMYGNKLIEWRGVEGIAADGVITKDIWFLNKQKVGSLSALSRSLFLSIDTYDLGLFLEGYGYEFVKPFGPYQKSNSKRKKLELKPTKGQKEKDLPIKDEGDYEVLKSAISIAARRDHNKITNKFSALMPKYVLEEGPSNNMYDILVRNYDSKNNDLLVEVKSSVEMPHVRMAVGQLYDYSRQLENDRITHLAVLLPAKPSESVVEFLNHRKIALLWLEDEFILTATDWLMAVNWVTVTD